MEKDMINSRNTVEIEILELKIGGNSYGIIISDIREILSFDMKPTPIPNSHPDIKGIIMPRDFLITIVDMKKFLKLSDVEDIKNEMLIVTSINNLDIAIHVDNVNGIHKIYKSEITEPGKKLSTSQKDVITGIFDANGRKIEIIDFTKVFKHINPDVTID